MTLKCGERIMRKGSITTSPCTRDAETFMLRDRGVALDSLEPSQLKQMARCSFHRKMVIRRYSRYRGSTGPWFVDVTPGALKAIEEYVAQQREAQRLAAEQQDAANKALHGERVAREWTALESEGPTTYTIVPKVETSEWRKTTEYTYSVTRREDGVSTRWEDWSVIVKDSSRYEDIPEPVSIEVRRSGSLTPEMAQAFAIALTMAAVKASQLNASKR